jgi:hypothetical protein
MVLKVVKIKISLWGHQAICVCVLACVPSHATSHCGAPLILCLLMDPYTFNPFIIFSGCTIIIIIIIIIIMTKTIFYINFLLLQSGFSEKIIRSSARNCSHVLWSLKICLFEPFKERLCCIRN